MGILDSLWSTVLPGQGDSQVSSCTALVPAGSHDLVPAPSGGGSKPPATGFDTGTGYDGYAYPKKQCPPEPVFDTKGPLNWVDRRNAAEDHRAYDGYGRCVYLIGPANGRGRFELHWYPGGTVWDETHSYMGGHYRSVADAKAVAQEDHIGRSGGKGYYA